MRRAMDRRPILIQKQLTWGASVKETAHQSMDPEKVSVYEIRVKGHLGGWSEWFDGLEIYKMENGEAVLSGEIVDQAALRCAPAKDARTWDCRWPL